MRTNFFRSTIILVLVIIVPVMFSGIQMLHKYSSDKAGWPYLLTFSGVILLSFVFLTGFLILMYSLFTKKKARRKM